MVVALRGPSDQVQSIRLDGDYFFFAGPDGSLEFDCAEAADFSSFRWYSMAFWIGSSRLNSSRLEFGLVTSR